MARRLAGARPPRVGGVAARACRRTVTVGVACAAVTLTVGLSDAFARGMLDQTSLPGNQFTGLVANETYEDAQTFTAGRTGFLDTVTLLLESQVSDGRYTVQVVPTNAGGVPVAPALASRSIEGCRVAAAGGGPFEIQFGPAAASTSGTRYAIVVAYEANSVSPNNPAPLQLIWGAGDPYAGGAAFLASPVGPNPAWAPAEVGDLGFSTYVSATAPAPLVRDATQTTVISSRNPAPPGPVTFTATVTDPVNAARIPTGSVAFRVGSGGQTWTQPLDAQGQASQTFEHLHGTSAITAAYCPSTDGFVSSSGTVSQAIVRDATQTTVVAQPQAIFVGQSTTVTATVQNIDAPGTTPDGTVQFSVDGEPRGAPVALQSGVATLATSSLAAGTHVVDAAYSSSDGFFAFSRGQVAVSVNRWPSSASITPSTSATRPFGEILSFTAKVSSADASANPATPTGTVQFVVDGFQGPAVALDANGEAQLDTFVDVGGSVIAHYGGSSSFASSNAQLSPSVRPAATSIAMTTSANPAAADAEVTIIATVSNTETQVVPFGSVQFLIDGEAVIEPLPLDDLGQTGIVASGLDPGAYDVRAHYHDDTAAVPDFLDSHAALEQHISAPTQVISAPAPPPTPSTITPLSPSPASNAFTVLRRTASSRGLIRLRMRSSDPGAFRATATRCSAAKRSCIAKSPAYGTGRTTSSAGGMITLTVRPNARARTALARGRSMRVSVAVTFQSANGGAAQTRRTTLLVKGRGPTR